MNDQDKIRALMIYYDHWGKEQNKLRDFMATMNKIKNVFVQKDKDNYHFLTEVQFLEIHIPLGYCKFHVLNDMANELLSGLGGVVRAPLTQILVFV